MNRAYLVAAIAASVLCLSGCQWYGQLDDLSWAEFLEALEAVDPPQESADGDVPGVRVRLVNEAGATAFVRVTMRIDGQRVHFSERSVANDSEHVVIGPDAAESVLVETLKIGTLSVSRPILQYFLHQDYQPGQTITVTIGPDHTPSDPNAPVDPNQSAPEKPAALAVALVGADQDRRVVPGTIISHGIEITGTPETADRCFVLLDADADLASGNETVVLGELPALATQSIEWVVPELAAGAYTLYAELRDGLRVVRSPIAAGRILVNATPQLVFDSPIPEQLTTVGRDAIISWAGLDPDDDAQITVFLDTDDVYDGSELILRDDVSEDDVNDRQFVLDTTDFYPGTYYVGGVIRDAFEQQIVYGDTLTLTWRLVGELEPNDVLPTMLTQIVGGPNDPHFGTSVDCTLSVNGEEDALADLLVGSPDLNATPEDRTVSNGGRAYCFMSSEGPWPNTLSADDAWMQFVGEQEASQVGQRVALLESTFGSPGEVNNDLLIGAPGFADRSNEGRAYFVDGAALGSDPNAPTSIDLANLASLYLGGALWGTEGETAGYGLATVGDVNGSGEADFLVGAPNAAGNGRAYLFLDTGIYSDGALDEYAWMSFEGVNAPGGLTGFAACGIAAYDANSLDDFAIGAPLAPDPEDPNVRSAGPGVVYVVHGDFALSEGWDGPYPLGTLAEFGFDELVLVGENPGDQAGYALAAGDFAGDNLTDLLVGAPGHGGGRGRVYLLRDIATSSWPRYPAVIRLADVGTSYPGTVIDGENVCDRLGATLHGAADFDWDFRHDLLLAAPQADAGRGAVYLLYGGPPRDTYDLADIGTTRLEAWVLRAGASAPGRLGAALSAGNVQGYGASDVAIGAPGDADQPGRVYLLFGWDGGGW